MNQAEKSGAVAPLFKKACKNAAKKQLWSNPARKSRKTARVIAQASSAFRARVLWEKKQKKRINKNVALKLLLWNKIPYWEKQQGRQNDRR